MSDDPLTIIILAAGQGTRMKSKIPKVMHQLAGRPMIQWVIDTAEQLEPRQIIVVAGPDMPDMEAAVAPYDIAVQHQQIGTGDAVRAALPVMTQTSGRVLILLGDEPFVPVDALRAMVQSPAPTVMAIETDNPVGLGRMRQREDGSLEKIVEDKDTDEHEWYIKLCNAGNFCLDYEQLKRGLERLSNDNAQGEYYLTELVEIGAIERLYFDIITVVPEHGWGINDRRQLAEHEFMVQDALRANALAEGVSLYDPASVYFAWDTKLGRDCVIEPHVVFGPGVEIGEGVHIKAFSHLEYCEIGNNCTVGPFARLRPGTSLAEDVKIGNFVEIKNATLGMGVKASHFGYIGDAEIGAGTNFSCGAITVNYDGYEKHQTIIGENVLVGSNVNLIAPLEVGNGAFIAAGSTISDSVPESALAIERSEAEVVNEWARHYRQRKLKSKT